MACSGSPQYRQLDHSLVSESEPPDMTNWLDCGTSSAGALLLPCHPSCWEPDGSVPICSHRITWHAANRAYHGCRGRRVRRPASVACPSVVSGLTATPRACPATPKPPPLCGGTAWHHGDYLPRLELPCLFRRSLHHSRRSRGASGCSDWGAYASCVLQLCNNLVAAAFCALHWCCGRVSTPVLSTTLFVCCLTPPHRDAVMEICGCACLCW